MTEVLNNLKEVFNLLTITDFIFLSLIIILIIILSTVLFIYRNSDETLSWEEDKTLDYESDDIKKIANALEKCNEQLSIDLTPYEMKEEEASIISYDELLKSCKTKKISYSDEIKLGNEDITIKKIDLTDALKTDENESYVKPITMSYEKEEALLQALKQLQQNLGGL